MTDDWNKRRADRYQRMLRHVRVRYAGFNRFRTPEFNAAPGVFIRPLQLRLHQKRAARGYRRARQVLNLPKGKLRR